MGMTTTLPASINLANIGDTQSGTGVVVANSGTTIINFDDAVVSLSLTVDGSTIIIFPGYQFGISGFNINVDSITVTAVGNGSTTLELVSGDTTVTPTVSIGVKVGNDAQVIVAEQSLQNIAASIRAKLGTSDTYLPSAMSAAIDSISGGGGGLAGADCGVITLPKNSSTITIQHNLGATPAAFCLHYAASSSGTFGTTFQDYMLTCSVVDGMQVSGCLNTTKSLGVTVVTTYNSIDNRIAYVTMDSTSITITSDVMAIILNSYLGKKAVWIATTIGEQE